MVELYPEGAERIPARIERQRAEALALANKRRAQAAELKRKIRSGELDPVAVLQGFHPEWEEHLMNTRVRHFLIAIPRIGDSRAFDILRELELTDTVKFKALSPARRADLTAIVRLIKWRGV